MGAQFVSPWLWAHLITYANATGHSVTQHTYLLLWTKYWWPNILSNINKYVSSHSHCWQVRAITHANPTTVTSRCWLYHWPAWLPGQWRLLWMGSWKSTTFIPLSELSTAFHTAELIFNPVFWVFWLPWRYCGCQDFKMSRYWGPHFTTWVWVGFKEKLGVSITSGYHPQANGQVEQANQEVGQYLSAYCWKMGECTKSFLGWIYCSSWDTW